MTECTFLEININSLFPFLKDYEFANAKSEYADVLQCNNTPSSRTPRGHQFPAAFLIRAAGLDKVICNISFTSNTNANAAI